jgi:hypothetical protein
MGNGYTLNVLCLDMRNVRAIAEVVRIRIKIEVVAQK